MSGEQLFREQAPLAVGPSMEATIREMQEKLMRGAVAINELAAAYALLTLVAEEMGGTIVVALSELTEVSHNMRPVIVQDPDTNTVRITFEEVS